jgi:hypothetical protein
VDQPYYRRLEKYTFGVAYSGITFISNVIELGHVAVVEMYG